MRNPLEDILSMILVNAYRKALLIVLGIGFHAALYSVNSLHNSSDELYQIECCEIIYRWGDYFTVYYEYHRITKENGVYRTSMGKEINETTAPYLPQKLVMDSYL